MNGCAGSERSRKDISAVEDRTLTSRLTSQSGICGLDLIEPWPTSLVNASFGHPKLLASLAHRTYHLLILSGTVRSLPRHTSRKTLYADMTKDMISHRGQNTSEALPFEERALATKGHSYRKLRRDPSMVKITCFSFVAPCPGRRGSDVFRGTLAVPSTVLVDSTTTVTMG